MSILNTITVHFILAFTIRYQLTSTDVLGNQWYQYINPYNQLFLFACGIYLYFNFKNFKLKTAGFYFIVIISILVFCFYPVYGDLINVVTGENRFILSLACIALVFAFFKGPIQINNSVVNNQLNNLGIASYSIYLLHPMVYNELNKLFLAVGIDSIVLIISTSAIVTVLLSWVVYKFYEEPFVKLGKNILAPKKKINKIEKESISS